MKLGLVFVASMSVSHCIRLFSHTDLLLSIYGHHGYYIDLQMICNQWEVLFV